MPSASEASSQAVAEAVRKEQTDAAAAVPDKKAAAAASSPPSKSKRDVGPCVPSAKSSRKVYQVHQRDFCVDEHYDLLKIVGYGAYGTVCSAKDQRTGKTVAIKRLVGIFDDLIDGRRILREVKVLTALRHPNILRLRDILKPEEPATMSDVYLVTDLMEADLQFIIRSKQRLLDAHVKYFVAQLIRALEYTHAAGVMHRDVKPSNMLVNSTCELVLCDYGLARAADENSLTGYVVTRWYRAPELLVLGHVYSYPVDMWSCGCVLAELLLRRPLFQGSNYLDQLTKVFAVIGTPQPTDDISHVSDEARRYIAGLPRREKRPLGEVFPVAPAEGIDLVDKLLRFVPKDRYTAKQALAHPYLVKVKASPPSQPPDDRVSLADDDGELTEDALRQDLLEAIERFHSL
jgi:mitogen-activated protein kinase 1/3